MLHVITCVTGTVLEDSLALEREAAINRPVLKSHSLPNSCGSANSTAQRQPYYIPSRSDSPSRPGPEKPHSRGAGSSTDMSLSEVLTQLRALTASSEELQRAVRDLQDSTVLLEARITELEAQWEHQEQVGPTPAECYHLTLRQGWYDDNSALAVSVQGHRDQVEHAGAV